MNLDTLEERLNNFIKNEGEYRKILQAQFDKILEKTTKNNEEFSKFMTNYILFEDHLEEHKKAKNIFRDRTFQWVIGITLASWSAILTLLIKFFKK